MVGIGSLILLVRPVVTIAGEKYPLCDVAGIVSIVGMTLIAIVSAIRNTVRLYREERIQ